MDDNMMANRGAYARLNAAGDDTVPAKDLGSNKLNVTDWLEGTPGTEGQCNVVEIRFKNTRKAYFYNAAGIPLKKGDVVAVEASPGHDIGVVSLTGPLVRMQLKKYNVTEPELEMKKVYRKARPNDYEKWEQAIAMEQPTMLRARQIAASLNLNMKISDVEYQGDKTKAIFYYISDDRVDFRELIKLYADEFKIRIEMKQIGARQEAGRIGGIGSCGRPLCCTSWMSNFVSVSTSAARYQDISLNPQKLAGQCGKLKCCLNYELKSYLDAQKEYPASNIVLDTEAGPAFHRKTDVFRRLMWYAYKKDADANELIPLDVDTVKEIIAANKNGRKVPALVSSLPEEPTELGYQNAAGEDSISRFEEKRKKHKKKKHGGAQQAAPSGNVPKEGPKNPNDGDAPKDDRPQGPNGDRKKPQGNSGNRQGNNQRPEGNGPRRNPQQGGNAPKVDRPQEPNGDRKKPQGNGGNRQGKSQRPEGNGPRRNPQQGGNVLKEDRPKNPNEGNAPKDNRPQQNKAPRPDASAQTPQA